jgi:5'-3' exonuclease
MGVQAEHYIGVLSPKPYIHTPIDEMSGTVRPAAPNFRKAIAKSRPYKGNRPEKPEWYLKWCPVIENHLEETWGFIRTPEGYEADDLCATLMSELTAAGAKPICCGNDKDLLQIPGEHFNVVKKTIQTLDEHQAAYKLWIQALMGDSTDGIEGIPGMGPKGAEKALNEGLGYTHYPMSTLKQYFIKFGIDVGIQKFYENYMLVKLRTDVPTDEFELQEACRGYNLEHWNSIQMTQDFAESQQSYEEIPSFGTEQEPENNFNQFMENHEDDHMLYNKKGEET